MRKLVAFLSILLLTSAGLMAQTIALDSGTGIDWQYFTSFTGLVAAIVPFTSLVNRVVNATGQMKQYLSWAVALALCVVPYYFDWGIFAGVDWYVPYIYALGAGLASNGVADTKLVQAILKALNLEPSRRKTPKL